MLDWLQTQEEAPELPVLAYAAGLGIDLGPDAPGAIRRAALLLATGGDPLTGLHLESRAVAAFAADLDTPARRAELASGLAELAAAAASLPAVAAALATLAADPDLAWRAFALGVLVDSLEDDE